MDGNPTTILYYGGLLIDGIEEIRFYWDGTYVRRSEPWEYDYCFNTPDGERTSIIRVEPDNDTVFIQDLGGESFFPYTGNDSATFYYTPQNVYGEADGEHAGEEGDAADLEYMTQIPEIHEKIMTHGKQYAKTDFHVDINGDNSSVNLVSRSVAKGEFKTGIFLRY